MFFNDPFSVLFSNGDGSDRGNANDDDPIILNVEADGDGSLTMNGSGSAGSSRPPRGPAGPRLTRKPSDGHGSGRGTRIFIGVVLALVIIVALFFGLSRFITDLMWYGQLGFQSVVWTQLGVKVGLWVAYALLMALTGFIAAWLAIRARPDSADGSTIRINGDVVEVGKSVSSKTARRVAVVVSLIVGVIFGSQFNANWSEILLMFNAQSFGTTDPQFGLDNGFYVFVLPGLKLVLAAVAMLLGVGLVFSLITHVLMGGIRITMPVNGRGLFAITKRCRRQLGIWLILNMLAWSVRQVLGVFDPQVVSPTFKQLQQSKQYYTFADTLAVDKYEIDGVSQDTVIAARELDLAGNDNRNWVNDHTVYTHGYGVVAAYGNKVTADGQPEFFESGIPTQGKLTDSEKYEPRIYFSPNTTEYSIVGAPEGTQAWEFDYPTGSEGALTTFKGDGGPSVGNLFSRILYAIRFGSDQILFSDRVTSESQILYDRSPKERVAKVAPYLTLDGRVYPAVVDGRVKWIVDGYTTSDAYPYSQMTNLGTATKDSTTVSSATVSSLGSQQANYIRNSVKATVDAYDGSVDLYVWDQSDPVIKAWEKIFPGQYHQLSDISGDLMSHMRYPESLFKVQRELLSKYHVTSANQYYSGEDFWQTPVDPTESQSQQDQDILQPPYYLTLQTGGTEEPVFSLTSTYIPAGQSTREILTGFLSVDSDAGDEKGKIGANYGTIRLQELPKDSNVPGPGQAQNNFNANADVSKELNLLQSGDTQVVRGNLLTLPLGGGLVYVQPVYVKSSGATSFPLLKKTLVAFGDQVGFADTLDEALDQVFGGDSGAAAGDAANVTGDGSSGSSNGGGQEADKQSGSDGSGGQSQSGGQSGSTDGKSDSGTTSNQSGASRSPELQQALNDAAQAMKDSQSAMKNGDWAAYGKAQQQLEEALNKAIELDK